MVGQPPKCYSLRLLAKAGYISFLSRPRQNWLSGTKLFDFKVQLSAVGYELTELSQLLMARRLSFLLDSVQCSI